MDIEIFENGLQKLTEIPSVEEGVYGKIADTAPRSVVEKTFSYCLNIICKNVNLHNNYQEHKIHKIFINDCSHMWKKVIVYDFET